MQVYTELYILERRHRYYSCHGKGFSLPIDVSTVTLENCITRSIKKDFFSSEISSVRLFDYRFIKYKILPEIILDDLICFSPKRDFLEQKLGRPKEASW